MSKGNPPKVLISATALLLVALCAWLAIGPYSEIRTESIAIAGTEWRVVGNKPVDHPTAIKNTPKGFFAASEDEILSLRSSEEFRVRFPRLFQPESAIWSNRQKPFEQKWYVVKLSVGSADETYIWDFPAWVVVKRSPE